MNMPQATPQAAPNQGIAALTGTQAPMGNPVQGQNQTPPPPVVGQDLLALIEANKRLELEQAAQRNTAMQQQTPPTVMQQTAQGLQQANAMRQQAMQAQAPAPQRGGIDQVPSNLRMAGGGIVGFSGERGSLVMGEDGIPEMESGTLYTDALAAAKTEDPNITNYKDGVGKAFGFLLNLPIEALKHIVSAPGYGASARKDAAAAIEAKKLPENRMGRGFNDPRIVTPQAAEADARPPLNGRGGQGIAGAMSARNAPAAPVSPAVKNRLEELADEIKAAHAAGNPEKAYALSQERSKLMDGGDDYMTAMKTIMGKQEALAKGEDRGILDKLIPLLRGAATSAPGAHWSQVLSGGAVGSIDHEAKLKAEQKKAQEELLKMQGQHAGMQYNMTSGRHNAGLGAEKEANTTKRQLLGDRVQIEGTLENSNMAKARLAQDAAQHKDAMSAKWSEIQERAKDRGDSKLQAQATQLENNIRNAATSRAAAEAKAAGVAFDPVDVQARAAIIMAQEMQSSVQFKALMAKLGMPLPEAPKDGAAGIDLSKWGQPKAK